MLYVAREDEPERHRGTVLRVHQSVFAPPEHVLRFVRPGALDITAFRLEYLRYLRALWRNDPDAFLRLIALASGGEDLILTDDFGGVEYALRRILAATLKQIAASRREEERRRARRAGDRAAG